MRNLSSLPSLFSMVCGVFLLNACSGSTEESSFSSVSEQSYCSTNQSFAGGNTITGLAIFKRRLFTNCGLGSVDPVDYPIRYAEVQVLNSSGVVTQCSETDAAGNFSFSVPNDNQVYTVKVNSRSYNSHNKASVLVDPMSNDYYSLTQTFTSNANQAVTTLRAEASDIIDPQVHGGAFNILDDILKANTYLTNNSSGTYPLSAKIQAYWKVGVNPTTYFDGDPLSGSSFYVPGSDQLFILGGINGDISISDTDHFDDSVIIHEFGHFVEDNYSHSDSPGGIHYGLFIIDPRLAWSEGFADFFQGAVRGDNIYRDTVGYDSSDATTLPANCGSTTGYLFNYNIESNSPPLDTINQGVIGEGNFREFAITRFLWDMIDAAAGEAGDSVQIPFSTFYTAYTTGFKNGVHFKDMGLLLASQAAIGPDISSLYAKSDEMMVAARTNYGAVDNSATPDNVNAAACKYTLQAKDIRADKLENGSFANSNQFLSNDFYYYYHTGGTLAATLNYVTTPGAGSNADLDLYIYNEGYTYGVGTDLLAYSANPHSGAQNDNGTELISIYAPAGYYMVNVQYYTGNTRHPAGAAFDPATYNITINGNLICK